MIRIYKEGDIDKIDIMNCFILTEEDISVSIDKDTSVQCTVMYNYFNSKTSGLYSISQDLINYMYGRKKRNKLALCVFIVKEILKSK